jgi:putative phosphoesterase
MRIAALYDVHGNLPALEAVLAEVERAAPDAIVVGGDVAPGPLVQECLERLEALNPRFVMGNGDREALPPERVTAFESVVRLGGALFCHGSPRSDTEIITRITPEERLAPMLAGVAEPVVVCGHTHQQFDRHVAGKRVVNAGSVGLPYEGDAAAFWLLLDDGEPQLRRTTYDVAAAMQRMPITPELEESFAASLTAPRDADEIAAFFEGQATTSRSPES